MVGLLVNVNQAGLHVALLGAGVEGQRNTVNVLDAKIAGTLVCILFKWEAQAPTYMLVRMLSNGVV